VAKMRHAYQVLIIVSLLVGLDMRPLMPLALKPEEPSNRVAQLDSARTDRRSFQDTTDAFSLVGENALFQLFADETTLAFRWWTSGAGMSGTPISTRSLRTTN